MTRKERIVNVFFKSKRSKWTCQQVTNAIIALEELTGNKAKYLSGGISSILAKLVKQGILKYAEGQGPKGGHIYQRRK